jgi:uncharacterized membrane protein
MQDRLSLLDTVRGLILVLVVLHHLAYDIETFCGVALPFLHAPLFLALRLMFVAALFVLSGITCSLSRSNLRRGGATFLCGMVVTAATALFDPQGVIRFGVLHCLGACRLLWALGFGRLIRKAPAVSLAIAVSAVLLLCRMTDGVLLVPFFGVVPLPALEGAGWLGFPDPSFASGDYFPLLPWLGVFLAGGALGAHWRGVGFPTVLRRDPLPILSRIGRHTLSVYLLHQPLLFLLLTPFRQ